MPRVLTDMDEDWRADQRLERDLRNTARSLVALSLDLRPARRKLAGDCFELSEKLREEAASLVRRWD